MFTMPKNSPDPSGHDRSEIRSFSNRHNGMFGHGHTSVAFHVLRTRNLRYSASFRFSASFTRAGLPLPAIAFIT